MQKSAMIYDGILFFYQELLPERIDAVYRLQVNEFNGKTSLQFLLEHWSHADHPVINDVY